MRRQMSLTIRLFCKDWVLPAFTGLFFLYFHYVLFDEARTLPGDRLLGDLAMLRATLPLSMLCFVFFTFVSYYFADKPRHDTLLECARVTRHGLPRLYGSQFLLLLALDLLFTLVAAGYNAYACFALQIGRAEAVLHILGCVLLYIFLVSLAGILLGMAAALTLNRFAACLVLVLFILLGSPLALYVAQALYYALWIDVFPVYEFLCLFPRGLESLPQHSVGYSLLPDRISATVFWLALFAVPVLWKTLCDRRRARRAAALACAVLCVGSLAVYLLPMARTASDRSARSGYVWDLDYYQFAEQKEEDGGFSVTGYDMDLTVGLQLSARVTAQVDQPALPCYKFTLYHGYQVSQVTDQDGTPLRFTQQGDTLAVENGAAGRVDSLTFTYAGDNPTYYAHAQGINLPGHFAYYPHSGYHALYDVENQSFYKLLTEQPVDVTLRVQYGKTVFCDLPQTGRNTFAGRTDGVTLLAGFLTEETVNGVQVVYPYLDTEQFRPEQLAADLNGFLASKTDGREIRKVMILPGAQMELHARCHLYSDGTLVCMQLRGLASYYERSFIAPQKQEAFNLLKTYRDDPENFENRLAAEQTAYQSTGETGMAMLLQAAVETLGEEEALARVDAYLADAADRRDSREFLEGLC